MSRSITIGYQMQRGGETTYIDVRSPYDLFGTQGNSTEFWSLPIWSEIGVTQLSVLGHSDPICFVGWDMMDELAAEIRNIHDNLSAVDSYPELKSTCISHLTYCYHLLISTAPSNSIPALTIG